MKSSAQFVEIALFVEISHHTDVDNECMQPEPLQNPISSPSVIFFECSSRLPLPPTHIHTYHIPPTSSSLSSSSLSTRHLCVVVSHQLNLWLFEKNSHEKFFNFETIFRSERQVLLLKEEIHLFLTLMLFPSGFIFRKTLFSDVKDIFKYKIHEWSMIRFLHHMQVFDQFILFETLSVKDWAENYNLRLRTICV